VNPFSELSLLGTIAILPKEVEQHIEQAETNHLVEFLRLAALISTDECWFRRERDGIGGK